MPVGVNLVERKISKGGYFREEPIWICRCLSLKHYASRRFGKYVEAVVEVSDLCDKNPLLSQEVDRFCYLSYPKYVSLAKVQKLAKKVMETWNSYIFLTPLHFHHRCLNNSQIPLVLFWREIKWNQVKDATKLFLGLHHKIFSTYFSKN